MGTFSRSSQSERKDERLASQGNKWKIGTTERHLQLINLCCLYAHALPAHSVHGKCGRVTSQLFNHPLKRRPFNSSRRKFVDLLATSMESYFEKWMVSSGPEPEALSFSSGDECKLNIWLQGVKETLPGSVYRQCSLMDLGVDDLQQDMWASVSSKQSCISLRSTLRFAGSHCFVWAFGISSMYCMSILERNLCNFSLCTGK